MNETENALRNKIREQAMVIALRDATIDELRGQRDGQCSQLQEQSQTIARFQRDLAAAGGGLKDARDKTALCQAKVAALQGELAEGEVQSSRLQATINGLASQLAGLIVSEREAREDCQELARKNEELAALLKEVNNDEQEARDDAKKWLGEAAEANQRAKEERLRGARYRATIGGLVSSLTSAMRAVDELVDASCIDNEDIPS